MAEDPEPVAPTPDQLEAFEDWKVRWEAAVEEGERTGWLTWYGYCDGHSAMSPQESYERLHWEWERRQEHLKDEEKKAARAALEAKADAAAKAARARVLKGADA